MMTDERKELIEKPERPEWVRLLRRVARLGDAFDNLDGTVTIDVECMERFAALVRADALEEAAREAEGLKTPIKSCFEINERLDEAADAIRKLIQAP